MKLFALFTQRRQRTTDETARTGRAERGMKRKVFGIAAHRNYAQELFLGAARMKLAVVIAASQGKEVLRNIDLPVRATRTRAEMRRRDGAELKLFSATS